MKIVREKNWYNKLNIEEKEIYHNIRNVGNIDMETLQYMVNYQIKGVNKLLTELRKKGIIQYCRETKEWSLNKDIKIK